MTHHAIIFIIFIKLVTSITIKVSLPQTLASSPLWQGTTVVTVSVEAIEGNSV